MSAERGARRIVDIRRENLGRILAAVARHPGIFQSELVESTGLAVGAVSSLVNELIALGHLTGSSPAATGRGRPRRRLHLADDEGQLVAASITRSGIDVRVATLAGRELRRLERRFAHIPPTGEQVAGELAAVVETALDILGDLVIPRHAAVGVPGRIHDGLIMSSVLDWDDVPERVFARALQEIGVPYTTVGNDGSFAALAESRDYLEHDVDNLVVLLLDRGLGGNAVVGGRLLSGLRNPPGFGHIPLDPSGPQCVCGLKGCAERYVSLEAFAELLGERQLLDAPDDDYAAHLRDRASVGDEAVLTTLSRARSHLTQLADILSSAFDPRAVLLSGRGAALADWLLVGQVGNVGTPMRRGVLGAASPVAGAIIAAQESVFADPVTHGRHPLRP